MTNKTQPKPRPATTAPRATRRGLTPREEAYAVARAAGSPALDAYLSSYDWHGSTVNARRQAHIVEQRERVAERIKELRDEYARRTVEASRGTVVPSRRSYSPDDAMAELDLAQEMARAKENPGALARIVEVRMKLFGLGVADARNPGDREDMTPEELEQALADLRAVRSGTRH